MNRSHLTRMLATAAGAALALGGVTAAWAADLQLAAEQPSVSAELNGDKDGMYIVMLDAPPVAAYDGGIAGFKGSSAKARGRAKFETNAREAKAYARYLKDQQKELLGNAGKAFGRTLETRFDYQHAVNGFAVELTAEEAKALRRMDGVMSVERERVHEMDTYAGPAWIGAPSVWGDNQNATMGEGVVVAILDSGINHDHPSFAEVGGDGYVHTNPLGSGNWVPGSYCDLVDPTFCNDKLIGAHTFVGEAVTPNDSNGHGSHTAATVAGNFTSLDLFAPTTTAVFDVSGVAPHANIIAYDVCVGGCPGAALVGALNQVVIDAGNLPNGIAALNYSISGSGNPYNSAVELGFLAASNVGVAVNASAGNSGPGAGTVAHKSPWITTVAASTHDGSLSTSLVDIDSGGGPIADMKGAGITSGYGPAPIVHANSTAFDPAGQCLNPFPAGTWTNGEIVVCDRGSIARVQKGLNVLAGGAGGFVLANLDAQGESIAADPHFLPATHIGDSNGDILRAYVAANPDAMATITPYTFSFDAAAGDVMAGFSSRGPQGDIDVLKPDVTAPGVGIFAAYRDGIEQTFLSGTSMSSPHSAGAHALIKAANPSWSPYEVKSAIMLSAEPDFMVKEDGVTPADPFDYGAGRVNLYAARDAGLVLSESVADFLAADPALGGDPSALNVASMQNSNCVGSCSWTRTVTNPDKSTSHWNVTASGPAGLGLDVTVSPEANSDDYNMKLKKGASADITVDVDTSLAPDGWHFGRVHLDRNLDKGPDLGMPIAVFASKASNPDLFTKSVDSDTAAPGDILTYEINVTNGPVLGPITVTDVVPDGTTFVPASETEVVTNGVTSSPWVYDGGSNSLSWTGELDVSSLTVAPAPLFGYVPAAAFGVTPAPCPSNCDDGGFLINGLDITFNGTHYTSGIWSINGTVELGTASGVASSFLNQNLPDPAIPNNILAPFWVDLNQNAGGNWYLFALTDGVRVWDIFEWEAIPEWPSFGANSFQIWLERGSSNITYTYGGMTAGPFGTVGVENDSGSVGDSYFFNGAGTFPSPGPDLGVFSVIGGTATLGFQVEIDCSQAAVNTAELSSGAGDEKAIAVTTCP